MPRRYPLHKYITATQQLADYHGLEVRVYEKATRSRVFNVFTKDDRSTPIESWAIRVTADEELLIESTEYLLHPAQNIRGAKQEQFDAIIEML